MVHPIQPIEITSTNSKKFDLKAGLRPQRSLKVENFPQYPMTENYMVAYRSQVDAPYKVSTAKACKIVHLSNFVI